jgi:FKBP-type peptidyl-prolyl cis-trans isomerase FklB
MNKTIVGLFSVTLATTATLATANSNNNVSEQEAYRLGTQLANNKDASTALRQGIEDGQRRDSRNQNTDNNSNRQNSSRTSNQEDNRSSRNVNTNSSNNQSHNTRNESYANSSSNQNTRNESYGNNSYNQNSRDEGYSSNNQNTRNSNTGNSNVGNTNSRNNSSNQAENSQQRGASNVNDRTFFAENGRRLGVVTTNSGLQYQVLKAGLGRIPRDQQNVRISYEIKDLNDKTLARQTDQYLRLNRLMPALAEGVQTMREKGKTRFFIPTGLTSGIRDFNSSVPANTAVIVDVDLQSIE